MWIIQLPMHPIWAFLSSLLCSLQAFISSLSISLHSIPPPFTKTEQKCCWRFITYTNLYIDPFFQLLQVLYLRLKLSKAIEQSTQIGRRQYPLVLRRLSLPMHAHIMNRWILTTHMLLHIAVGKLWPRGQPGQKQWVELTTSLSSRL